MDTPGTAPETLRLFVAVELSDEWRAWFGRAIRRLGGRIPEGYRWVRPELLHLTLVFLGSQPRTELPRIVEAVRLATANRPRFALTIGQLGAFGGVRPRVLWVSVGDTTNALPALRRRLDSTLSDAGITYDRKPLVPHITVARARTPSRLARNVLAIPPDITSPLPVSQVALIQSELRPDGPRHAVLTRVPLGG